MKNCLTKDRHTIKLLEYFFDITNVRGQIEHQDINEKYLDSFGTEEEIWLTSVGSKCKDY